MSSRLVTVSKYLSKHLRHQPEALGLTLEPGGWVCIDTLLQAAADNGFRISYDEFLECVETNDKQRFSIDDSGDRVRANQGHSVAVDLQLDPKEPPGQLYHGTVERFLESIEAQGLLKGRRQHVHLSLDRATATKVGARRGKPIILIVDAAGMHLAGHVFYVSTNGVWLTDRVPPQFLKRDT
jgi:putative RNA 2'-phosphotransferase